MTIRKMLLGAAAATMLIAAPAIAQPRMNVCIQFLHDTDYTHSEKIEVCKKTLFGKPPSKYCDEQSTKSQSQYCWSHGGDARPGGQMDRCIKAMPAEAQYFNKINRCHELNIGSES
jgi:hypothetical protein